MATITSTVVAAGAAAHRRAMGLPDEPHHPAGTPRPPRPAPIDTSPSSSDLSDQEAFLRQQNPSIAAAVDAIIEQAANPGFEGDGGRSGGGGATGEW